jgi:riboflavin biosynthesis pyrimidine reductase
MSSDPSLKTLYEAPDLPTFPLPEELETIYGRFGMPEDVVLANFVSSIDGVVAIPGTPKASPLISGGHPADRFVVALLRAAADAVVIGAGTYRAHEGPWTSERAFPDRAEVFAELRQRLGVAPEPTLVVVTRSGSIGPPRPILRGAIIVTTTQAASTLGDHAAAGATVVALEEASVGVRELLAELRDRGFRRILTEGGPDLMGRLLAAFAVDELFLTVAPALLGGGEPPPTTLGGGSDLRKALEHRARLKSVRRSDDLLFLRYTLRTNGGALVSPSSP